MCCQGCRAAAEWIEQLGLSDYYALRTAPAQTPALDVGHAAHGIEVPLEVLQEALKAVLLPGGRIRAVRPMAPSGESEDAPAPAEAPPSASAN